MFTCYRIKKEILHPIHEPWRAPVVSGPGEVMERPDAAKRQHALHEAAGNS